MHTFSVSDLLPYPEPRENNIGNEFIDTLENLEDNIRNKKSGNVNTIKKITKCCLCKKTLTSSIYECNKFTWPGSYKHYIVEHNVHPSKKFMEFVISAT